ncbi:MAG: TIGR00282 family metallophosphoesterase [Deltaproteobacteria bacterium]|nr:TIGR00282 family metallophosphoesterase [Candidatus Tharpella sp.]
MVKILFIGDIIGRPGRRAVAALLPALKSEHDFDLVIANGENAAGGFGLTPKIADELFGLGIDVITSGNHIWDQKEIEGYLRQNCRLLRPANYPVDDLGRGAIVVELDPRPQVKVGIINLAGRVFLGPADCPFRAGRDQVARLRLETPIIVVDFHAEASSEKNALATFLDGQVSLVVGTHTHVQTADERILPRGTACITDVGMVGGRNSVIGMKPDRVIEKFLNGKPQRYEVDKKDIWFSAVIVEIDEDSGEARSLQRLQIPA